MPTYEYKCTACGHAFEQFQSITAPPVKRCPQCGKAKVKRQLGTGAGVIIKASGFYTTDYRDASYKEKAKAESGGGGTGGSSEGGSESKSGGGETKSDAKPAESKPAASDAKPAAPKPSDKSEKKPKK
jgi:putative FmdB family regulatory protein